MDYRIRLLDEYRDIIRKRTNLQNYIEQPREIDKQMNDLMNEQLETMVHYEEILFKRIAIIMGVNL